MAEFENRYPENIKKFLFSTDSKNCSLISKESKRIENILKGQDLEETGKVEYYNEISYQKETLKEKCENVLSMLPIQYFKDEFMNIINNLYFEGNDLDNLIINYGDRISLESRYSKKFEEWRNVLSKHNTEGNILFSLHLVFNSKTYELKMTYKN